MIDLTADVSATVLAATAAKLEAEQSERDEAEVQKNVAAAVRPFQQKVVCALWAVSVLSCSLSPAYLEWNKSSHVRLSGISNKKSVCGKNYFCKSNIILKRI